MKTLCFYMPGTVPFASTDVWEKPLGGLEHSVTYLSKYLSERYEVVWMFGHKWGQMEDVKYRVEPEGNKLFDILIILSASRKMEEWKKMRGPVGRVTICWSHLAKDLLKVDVDGIVVGSVFLWDFWGLPDKKRFLFSKIIPLGYDPVDFLIDIKQRRRNHLCYCSIPNRGLSNLFDWWEDIRKIDKGIELNIYSGWELYRNEGVGLRELECRLSGLEGIKYFGAVSFPELLRGMSQCGILAYPCNTEETFCLVNMFAQRLGLPVVTSNLAALAEYADSQLLVSVVGHDVNKDLFLANLRLLIQDDHFYEIYSKRALERFRSCYTWERIAWEWIYFIESIQIARGLI